jgi:hypothetical protein
MKVINDLHQLIRDNYDKIAEMPKDFGNISKSQPHIIYPTWMNIYYKGLGVRVAVFKKFPQSDELVCPLPFNEQLWTDFYNELKEALNEN